MLTLSDGDFNRLYTYIQQHYGINLSHKKMADRNDPPFKHNTFVYILK